jgi:hypothetical protein
LNASLTVDEHKGALVFNEGSVYVKDWPPYSMRFTFQITNNLKDTNFKTISDISVNPCTIHKSLSGNYFMKSIFENYYKNTNESLCSIRKVSKMVLNYNNNKF